MSYIYSLLKTLKLPFLPHTRRNPYFQLVVILFVFHKIFRIDNDCDIDFDFKLWHS